MEQENTETKDRLLEMVDRLHDKIWNLTQENVALRQHIDALEREIRILEARGEQ